MRMRWIGTLALLMAWMASGVTSAKAEELSLSSYNELMARIEALEANNAALSRQAGGGCATCAPGGCTTCQPACGSGCGGMFVNVEAVYVMPAFANNSAFVAENDALQHVGFNWDLEMSPRVEVGYLASSCGLGWRARAWHFEHATGFFANDTNGLIPDDEAAVYFGGDVGLDDIDSGTFTHSLRVTVIDLEALKQTRDNLRWSAGLRYARFDQDYLAVTDEGDAFSRMVFEGIGPTVSLELRHKLGCSNLTVFSTLRASSLAGDKNWDARSTQSDYDGIRYSDSWALALNAEIQLGVEWCSGPMFVRAALEAQYWNNIGSALPGQIAADNSSGGFQDYDADSPLDDDLGFYGFTVGAGVRY